MTRTRNLIGVWVEDWRCGLARGEAEVIRLVALILANRLLLYLSVKCFICLFHPIHNSVYFALKGKYTNIYDPFLAASPDDECLATGSTLL
ncbi:MAG: hypothetical protein ACTS7I_02465 [Candidatus Hodgkinia cicadicola]